MVECRKLGPTLKSATSDATVAYSDETWPCSIGDTCLSSNYDVEYVAHLHHVESSEENANDRPPSAYPPP